MTNFKRAQPLGFSEWLTASGLAEDDEDVVMTKEDFIIFAETAWAAGAKARDKENSESDLDEQREEEEQQRWVGSVEGTDANRIVNMAKDATNNARLLGMLELMAGQMEEMRGTLASHNEHIMKCTNETRTLVAFVKDLAVSATKNKNDMTNGAPETSAFFTFLKDLAFNASDAAEMLKQY